MYGKIHPEARMTENIQGSQSQILNQCIVFAIAPSVQWHSTVTTHSFHWIYWSMWRQHGQKKKLRILKNPHHIFNYVFNNTHWFLGCKIVGGSTNGFVINLCDKCSSSYMITTAWTVEVSTKLQKIAHVANIEDIKIQDNFFIQLDQFKT